jgi:hypothetical protein
MVAFECFCVIGCASGGGTSSKATGSGDSGSALNINVRISASVTITWTTDQPATSQVEYGTTTAYANLSPLDTTPTTNHSVTLTDLSKNTIYHYRVLSSNASGTQMTSGDLTFATQ